MLDLTQTADDAQYDAAVRQLLASGITHSTTPTAPQREPAPNMASIQRVAYLLVRGAQVYSGGHRWPVLGDGPTSTAGAWDGMPLPDAAYLSADLTGHTEIYARRGFKVAYRQCQYCAKGFSVKRPASKTARWPSYCGETCRKAEYLARKRDARKNGKERSR